MEVVRENDPEALKARLIAEQAAHPTAALAT
jgi:hypothetical protein